MSTHEQRAEALEYLNAHVDSVHRGLQALMALLQAAPPATPVRAMDLVALLQPLASEASQAEPLTRVLLEDEGATA